MMRRVFVASLLLVGLATAAAHPLDDGVKLKAPIRSAQIGALPGMPPPPLSSRSAGCPPVGAQLLLHFDGSNGATTAQDFADSHAQAFGASSALSTASAKFGTASYLAVSDVNSGVVSTPSSSLTFSGDMTIELWFNANGTSAASNQYLISLGGPTGTATQNNFGIYRLVTSGFLGGFVAIGSTFFEIDSNSTSYTDSAWHSTALVRSGNSLYFFIDGTQMPGSPLTLTGGGTNTPAGMTFTVGNFAPGLNVAFAWSAYIDEVMFSNVARYTANYTPATKAFCPP